MESSKLSYLFSCSKRPKMCIRDRDKNVFFEAARRYSREVEHSDLNLERLENLFREEKVCGLDRLLTLVMG